MKWSKIVLDGSKYQLSNITSKIVAFSQRICQYIGQNCLNRHVLRGDGLN